MTTQLITEAIAKLEEAQKQIEAQITEVGHTEETYRTLLDRHLEICIALSNLHITVTRL